MDAGSSYHPCLVCADCVIGSHVIRDIPSLCPVMKELHIISEYQQLWSLLLPTFRSVLTFVLCLVESISRMPCEGFGRHDSAHREPVLQGLGCSGFFRFILPSLTHESMCRELWWTTKWSSSCFLVNVLRIFSRLPVGRSDIFPEDGDSSKIPPAEAVFGGRAKG